MGNPDPRHDILFTPIQLGPKTAPNRFYQTPHATGLGESAAAGAALRRTKAEGGWGVVNTEAVKISYESDMSGFRVMSWLLDESDASNWRRTCEEVHEHGSLIGIELLITASKSSGFGAREPAGRVSAIQNPGDFNAGYYEMDLDDIARAQQRYVDAALLARDAGFDIINIYGAEGAGLPLEFLSPWYNRRSDGYGGSLRNRARFWLEVLEKVGDAVGSDLSITARFNPCQGNGRTPAVDLDPEGLQFIEMADDLVDFWDIQVGRPGPLAASSSPAARFGVENYASAWVRQVKSLTDKPVVAPGWFTSADAMASVISSGQQDLIGAARPSIADPFLPAKIRSGEFESIRECIGCNVCVSRYDHGGRIVCTQNATLGEEYRRGWHPERFTKSALSEKPVLIVGAGPAGLELASVLARRGHEAVHVVDAAPMVGGHYRWVSKLPGLGAWVRIIDYREQVLQQHKAVEVITDTRLTVPEILDYGAAVVVTATGSQWSSNGLNGWSRQAIPGADAIASSWQFTPEQIMAGDPVDADKVLIYDCDGYYMAPSLAEKLLLEGKHVTVVTPYTELGRWLAHTGERELINRIQAAGAMIVTGTQVARVDGGQVSLVGGGLAAEPTTVRVDAVVWVTQRVSDDILYRGLVAYPALLQSHDVERVLHVGDARAPRMHLADTIFDAHRLGREIDSATPDVAAPYIREHRVLGWKDADYDAILRANPTPIQ
ncbi:NAD(P)-binding protein [Nocardioides sp. NPDC023903]|uniref:oxidoreductase n=1 Tax=Nocardioides sp. NPDC023903 TaxID=3157195 RepID=UPI00340FCFD4